MSYDYNQNPYSYHGENNEPSYGTYSSLAPGYTPESFLRLARRIWMSILCQFLFVFAAVFIILYSIMPNGHTVVVEEAVVVGGPISPGLSGTGMGIFFIFLLIAGMICGFVSLFSFLLFIYRCWRIIQDGYARTTPGRAVGFLFIPIFNIYWIFVAFYGLAEDMNAFCNRYGIGRPVQDRVNTNVLLASLIFYYTGIIISFFSIIALICGIFSINSLARVAAKIQEERNRQENAALNILSE
ncbi:MAG: hypothetical protein Q4C96_07575 [Planctomycetia bacterium]|nr:hypothetical protein [Planctomycetia bacterium]